MPGSRASSAIMRRLLVVDFARGAGVGERVGDQGAQPGDVARLGGALQIAAKGVELAARPRQASGDGSDRLRMSAPRAQQPIASSAAATLRRVGIGNISESGRAILLRARNHSNACIAHHHSMSVSRRRFLTPLRRPCRRGRHSRTLVDIHAQLYRSGLRSFRRRALLRSRRIAAEELSATCCAGSAKAAARHGRTWAPSPFSDTPPARVMSGVRLSFVGHASWLIQTAGLNILVDPVWSQRASPVSFAGPKRVNDPGIAFDEAAADRCGAGVARPLRSSRCRDAVEAARDICAARGHAARQRPDHEVPMTTPSVRARSTGTTASSSATASR